MVIMSRILALLLLAAVVAIYVDVRAEQDNRIRFRGIVEALPDDGLVGEWTISGRTVLVTERTRIDETAGPVELRALVEVRAVVHRDRSIEAIGIQVKDRPRDDAEIRFVGTIERLPDTDGWIGDWLVGGRTVTVTSRTTIIQEDGRVAIGAFVHVQGAVQPNHTLLASRIEVKSNVGGGDGRHEFRGVIERLPDTAGFIGQWLVSGRVVHVSELTRIDQSEGRVEIGAFVEVAGILNRDRSLNAMRIRVRSVDRPGQRVRFGGSVEELPDHRRLIGEWTVSGRTVHVTRATEIRTGGQMITIGTRVRVVGVLLDDRSVQAEVIHASVDGGTGDDSGRRD